MLATLLCATEGVVHHTLHTECRVDADLCGDLVRSTDADRSPGSGVRPLGALADYHEVDVGITRERTVDPGVQPRRTQIDVVVQREPDAQQQATFQHAAGHRRITDGTEQDRVVTAQLVDHGVGQHLAGRVVATRTKVIARLVDAGHDRVEHLECLTDHFGSDTVAGNDRQFHYRSTTSSSLAPTGSVIAARTSAGTSRSMRSRTVAPGPSASSLS